MTNIVVTPGLMAWMNHSAGAELMQKKIKTSVCTGTFQTMCPKTCSVRWTPCNTYSFELMDKENSHQCIEQSANNLLLSEPSTYLQPLNWYHSAGILLLQSQYLLCQQLEDVPPAPLTHKQSLTLLSSSWLWLVCPLLLSPLHASFFFLLQPRSLYLPVLYSSHNYTDMNLYPGSNTHYYTHSLHTHTQTNRPTDTHTHTLQTQKEEGLKSMLGSGERWRYRGRKLN